MGLKVIKDQTPRSRKQGLNSVPISYLAGSIGEDRSLDREVCLESRGVGMGGKGRLGRNRGGGRKVRLGVRLNRNSCVKGGLEGGCLHPPRAARTPKRPRKPRSKATK